MPSVNDTTQQTDEYVPQENFNPKPVNSLKTILLIVVGLVFVSAIAFAGFWYGKKSQAPVVPEKESTPSTEEAKEELPTEVDETAGWKTYTNGELTFKYPAEWVVASNNLSITGANPKVTLYVAKKDSTLMNECMKRSTVISTEEYVLVKFTAVTGIPACSDENASSRDAWVVQSEESYAPGISYMYSTTDNPEAEVILGKILSTFKFTD